MTITRSEKYNGWKIDIGQEENMCSNFCFNITDADGKTQHVSMGGDSTERALERARSMIDMENELAAEY